MTRPDGEPRARLSCRVAARGVLAAGLLAFAPVAAPGAPVVPDPDPWLDVTGAALAGVSEDGTVVAFRRQHEGLSQLFRTDAKGDSPVRVTLRDEAVDFAVLSPDGSKAVVGYDDRGDENDGLYLVEVGEGRDGRECPLSAAKGVQHGSVVWALQGDRIFFRDNGTSRSDFHLREMRLSDKTVKTVLARTGSWSVQDADPAGARLLVGHYRSNRDASIHLLDLASGATREIDAAPPGKTVAAGEARFLGAGDEVLFLSDRDGDYRRAYVVGVEGGEVRPLLSPAAEAERGGPCDVDDAVPARDGKTAVVVENRGGWGVPFRVDVRTGAVVSEIASTARDAVVSGVHLDAGGTVFHTRSLPNAPASVNRWSGAAGEAPVTIVPGVLGRIARTDLPAPPRAVAYPTFDGRRIPAWLHLPRSVRGGPVPFVVHVHGGPEGQERPTFSPDRAYLLSLGFGVLAPNVRGSTGYGRAYRDLDDYKKRLDSVRDVKAAADWLVAEELADPKRIAVVGGSYGGYVVLACLTEFPDAFAAGVDVVGIANFETFLERTAPYRRALREAEYGPLSDREFLRSISPLHKVDRIRAPLFVAHGENDPRVPVHEARQIEAALRARKVPVRALYFPDEGHGWQRRENRRTYLRAAGEFLRDVLGG